MSPDAPITPDLLLRLRLVVARYGEMDLARWWNTRGQLGSYGASALKRGFPRTHHFAQARSVFTVASERCRQVFNPAGCVTLWRMTDDIEGGFEAEWEHWLDNAGEWSPFFESIRPLSLECDLAATLRRLGLAGDDDLEELRDLRAGSGSRSVQLASPFSGSQRDVRLLALAFSKGEPGSLVVPYARTAADAL